MAELVQLHMEGTLPELEQMERVGLFTRDEIRMIIKRRKVFEYRLHKRQKKKDDFIKYIEFEVNLLSLIRKRRERLLCDFKRQEIDHSIAMRINKLFKAVILRFQDDVTLWLNQIQFCQRMKWHHSISSLYTRMLQVHSSSPSLWVMAAKWEMEENHSPENARILLQRGLRFNEESDILWREYFRMELMYSDLVQKRRESLGVQIEKNEDNETDAVLDGKIAIVVYDNATKAIADVNFALSFIQICQDFDFTKKHINHILDDVQKRHPDKEETLDALAKQPLLNLEEEIKHGKEKGLSKKKITRKFFNEVCSKYDDAVEKLKSEKMWSFYLEFLLCQLKTAKKEKARINIQTNLLNLMKRAAEADCLSCSHYSEWASLLYDIGEKDAALSVSLTAAQKWNKVSLWLMCLTLHIQSRKRSKEVNLLFNEALNALDKKESFPLWQMGVEWLSLSDPSKMVDFFENGIRGCKEISMPLKEMYLEATAVRNGVQAARDLYKKLKKMYPISPELFKKMILIESAQIKPSIECLRKYFEDALREYSSSNVDLWLNYMKMEVEHPEGNPGSYGMLYWRAMKALDSDLSKEFITRVTLYATGHGLSTNWEVVS